jgi:ribonuclease R
MARDRGADEVARKSATRPALKAKAARALPTKADILEFVKSAEEKVGKREIARAFGIKGSDRIVLKRLLAELAQEGAIVGRRKGVRKTGSLPPVAVVEVTGRDADGDLIAEPLVWDREEGARPKILLVRGPRFADAGESALAVGDRVLARVQQLEEVDVEGFRFEAEPIKKLPREKRRLLGIFHAYPRGGGVIAPVDRKDLRDWPVKPGDEGGARNGDLIRFELARSGRFGVPQARVIESLGNPQDQRRISLIAVHAHGIPDDFPEGVLAEVDRLEPPRPDGRADLRGLPLVTIDPEDARDHDDAVHAEPDPDPHNRGGFVVTVAIADVAHYVRPGSRLDREAQIRGNSVYFPDRVVPMLPEPISNDLCSLRESQDRPCLAVRMVFDRRGDKRGHQFMRAVMRSAAKLSYGEAQAAIEGKPSPKCRPLMAAAIEPLWAAWRCLATARAQRDPLELELPERKIVLDRHGRVERVLVPDRLDAHRLIEEFMIQANVAAAETLEKRRTALIYRAHAAPSKEKLTALRDFLDSLEIRLPPGELTPSHFNRVLAQARTLPTADLVNEVVLRAQAQAEYTTENYGHFGLNLRRYAHFTSPIRRYADLVVHRALVRALKLGSGGLADEELARLPEVARSISECERRAMAAERETVDRLIAAHLADRVGVEFDARISGVTRSGLFVRLRDSGADGFVPASSMIGDFYHHVEEAHALVGSRSGRAYRLGDSVRVRLVEAIATAGALRFEMLSEGKRGHVALSRGSRGRRMPRRRARD